MEAAETMRTIWTVLYGLSDACDYDSVSAVCCADFPFVSDGGEQQNGTGSVHALYANLYIGIFFHGNYSADSGNSTGISEYLFSAAFGIAALDCFADSSLSAVSAMENGRCVCLVGVPHCRSCNRGDCGFSAASDLPETPEGNAPRKLILCG